MRKWMDKWIDIYTSFLISEGGIMNDIDFVLHTLPRFAISIYYSSHCYLSRFIPLKVKKLKATVIWCEWFALSNRLIAGQSELFCINNRLVGKNCGSSIQMRKTKTKFCIFIQINFTFFIQNIFISWDQQEVEDWFIGQQFLSCSRIP